MGSTWIVAYASPNILDLIEAMGAPIIASLLCLLPMYAIRKAPSLAKYRGRTDNVFVTVIGLLTILNIVYKLFLIKLRTSGVIDMNEYPVVLVINCGSSSIKFFST